MDSTVYDSGNAGDSESWSSSEGEQVIEISSHSRILISPRKTRGSNWNNKSTRSQSKRITARVDYEREEVKSPGSQTSRHSLKTRQSKKSWVSPRKKKSDNQPVSSNNLENLSGGESDGSPRDDSDSAASSESDDEPRVSRKKSKKTSNPYKYLARKALEDSIQSLDSPTTPGKEMAELKATLKKLARHDDGNQNSIIQKEANISSATALREYLTAATAVTAANQSRPIEYTKARAASFHQPRPKSNLSSGSAKSKPKSMRENGNGGGLSSFNSKLFSTPPPPFSGAGFALPGQKSNFTSGNGGTQASRAMLSALKALQDKITRLEEERERLMQQLSDTKLTARKREAEFASTEKKYAYELGQTKESARAAYDALRCDREELKLQLVKSEERRKAIQTELQHFQELTKNLSAKSDDLQSQLQISESHRTRLRAELKESETNHQRAVNELQEELAQVRQVQQTAVERNELLEAQYQRESTNHAESRERLKDSEQTVASISQLNEKLVTKVMEATEAANQAMKKNKKLQQQIRPSTLLQPTAASRASAAAASAATSRRAANSQGGTGVPSARVAKKKKTSTETASSTATKKPKKVKSTNNMTLLREANLGKEIPFLLGNSAQPSFSLIGNIQDAMRRSDATYAMPTLLSSAPTTPNCIPIPRPTKRKTHSSANVNNLETEADIPQNLSSGSLDEDVSTAEQLISTSTSPPGSHRHHDKQKPPAINVSSAQTKTYVSSMQSQIMEDLHAAVTAAEKEFKGLNKRYKDLVAQMEENNRRGSKSTKADSTTSAQFSQALGPLLDELEAKAKQLNLLKQVYQQAASSTINPQRHVVISPEAVRRKTASLRVLNEYRQLESDSKSKGSGLSAPPYQLGANGFFR